MWEIAVTAGQATSAMPIRCYKGAFLQNKKSGFKATIYDLGQEGKLKKGKENQGGAAFRFKQSQFYDKARIR
jgi:hypothetical protein